MHFFNKKIFKRNLKNVPNTLLKYTYVFKGLASSVDRAWGSVCQVRGFEPDVEPTVCFIIANFEFNLFGALTTQFMSMTLAMITSTFLD